MLFKCWVFNHVTHSELPCVWNAAYQWSCLALTTRELFLQPVPRRTAFGIVLLVVNNSNNNIITLRKCFWQRAGRRPPRQFSGERLSLVDSLWRPSETEWSAWSKVCSDTFSSDGSVFRAEGAEKLNGFFFWFPPPFRSEHGADRCKMSLNRKAWWLWALWRALQSAAVRNRAQKRLINKRAPVFMSPSSSQWQLKAVISLRAQRSTRVQHSAPNIHKFLSSKGGNASGFYCAVSVAPFPWTYAMIPFTINKGKTEKSPAVHCTERYLKGNRCWSDWSCINTIIQAQTVTETYQWVTPSNP